MDQSVLNVLGVFGETQVIVILVITLLFVVTFFGILTYQLRLREFRLREQKQSVELELMRAAFESKIYDLTDRMVGTKDRWADLNGIILEGVMASEKRPSRNIRSLPSNSPFLHDLGIRDSDIPKISEKVFILTPFHDKYDEFFKIVKYVCGNLGLVAVRGDEKFLEANILKHIVTEIISANLVIANIDGRNPNVFYELGIAQSLGKPIILLTSSITEVPTDLRSQKIVVWKNHIELERELTKSLARFGLEQKIIPK